MTTRPYHAPCCGTPVGKWHKLSCRNQGPVEEPPPAKWNDCGPAAIECEGPRPDRAESGETNA